MGKTFPSPCGVLVLKSLEEQLKSLILPKFPSPCGVLVLKKLGSAPFRRRR